jgi:hypothetical protein
MISMQLAGTVGLPTPYPATGKIFIDAGSSAVKNPAEIHLELVHQVNHRVRITRWVALDQVQAILASDDQWAGKAAREAPAVSLTPGRGWTIKLLNELIGVVRPRITAAKQQPVRAAWLDHAIVFVAETTPVLMRVEVGMTAAESAEYYPPLAPPPLLACVSKPPE